MYLHRSVLLLYWRKYTNGFGTRLYADLFAGKWLCCSWNESWASHCSHTPILWQEISINALNPKAGGISALWVFFVLMRKWFSRILKWKKWSSKTVSMIGVQIIIGCCMNPDGQVCLFFFVPRKMCFLFPLVVWDCYSGCLKYKRKGVQRKLFSMSEVNFV